MSITLAERFADNQAALAAKRAKPVLPQVRRVGDGPQTIHVATGFRDVNGMPLAATKCFLNFLGAGTWEITSEPATCGTCTKV